MILLEALELAEEYETAQEFDVSDLAGDSHYDVHEIYDANRDEMGDYDEMEDDYLDDSDKTDEYVFDRDVNEEDIEPDLTEIINDDSVIPDAAQLGIALGLAEEIAIESQYREMDSIANGRAASLPKGSIMESFKSEVTRSKGGKFEQYVNSKLKR